MQTLEAVENSTTTQTDFLPLLGTDYVEFYVGNARQAAHFYKTAFGFQSLAYLGPETGVKDRASYAVRQNKLTNFKCFKIYTNTGIITPLFREHCKHFHQQGVVDALIVEDLMWIIR